MRRVLIWLAGAGALLVAAFISLQSPEPCFACTTANPPPSCNINMSGMTIRKGDDHEAWWKIFAPRDEQTLHLYMGLDYNNGVGNPQATYQISVNNPAVNSELLPESQAITFNLNPAGTSGANDTRKIDIPYGAAPTGDLTVTAALSATNQICPDLPPLIQTRVRINDDGPTMWPITPRTCPLAGTKNTLSFGIHNGGDQTVTYNVVARASNPQIGSETFLLAGQQTAEARLDPITLESDETKTLEITCETFGFCLTGAENQVQIELTPVAASAETFTSAFATSNVTIKDPNADCNELTDYWFVMPPAVLAGLIGVPVALLLGGTAFALRGRYTTVPDPNGDSTPPPESKPPTTPHTPSPTSDGKGISKIK